MKQKINPMCGSLGTESSNLPKLASRGVCISFHSVCISFNSINQRKLYENICILATTHEPEEHPDSLKCANILSEDVSSSYTHCLSSQKPADMH